MNERRLLYEICLILCGMLLGITWITTDWRIGLIALNIGLPCLLILGSIREKGD